MDDEKAEENQLFLCDICGSILGAKDELELHLEVHDSPDGCGIANSYSSLYRDQGILHPEIAIGKQDFLCEFCGGVFSTCEEIGKHLKTRDLDGSCVVVVTNDSWQTNENDEPGEIIVKRENIPREFTGSELETKEQESCVQSFESQNNSMVCETGSSSQLIPDTLNSEIIVPHNFACEVCGCLQTTENELESHLKTHDPPDGSAAVMITPDCVSSLVDSKKAENDVSQKSPLLKRIRKERALQSQSKRFPCETCSKKFSSNHDLKLHILLHTGERPYACFICGRRFRQKGTMVKHTLVHSGEKRFPCNICQKRFTQKSSLKTHLLVHKGDKAYSCETCKKSFLSQADVRRHQIVHSEERPFPCELCQRGFKTKSQLKKHRVVHTGEKPHTCDVCQQSFSDRNYLNVHLRTHTGEKPFKCDTCHEQFTEKRALKRHVSIHTGKKPYSCETCKKAFMSSESLKKHKNVHTGKQTFNCYICKNNFATIARLNEHIVVHTGEKPFSCDICMKGFTRKTGLRAHLLLHSSNCPYKCEICQKGFAGKRNLTRHMLVHEREKLKRLETGESSGTQVLPLSDIKIEK